MELVNSKQTTSQSDNSKLTTSQSNKSRLEGELFGARKKEKLENKIVWNAELKIENDLRYIMVDWEKY